MGLIGDAIKQVDDDLESAWKQYACPLYANNPTQFVLEQFGQTPAGYVARVLGKTCGEPPPPPDGISGGQCPKRYRVAATIHYWDQYGDENVVVDQVVVVGPVRQVGLVSLSTNTENWTATGADGIQAKGQTGYFIGTPPRRTYAEGTSFTIVNEQGQPTGELDNCGSSGGTYPPLPQGYQDAEPPRPINLPDRPPSQPPTPRPPGAPPGNGILLAAIGGLYGAMGLLGAGMAAGFAGLSTGMAAGFAALGAEIGAAFAAAAAGNNNLGQAIGNWFNGLGDLLGAALGSGNDGGSNPPPQPNLADKLKQLKDKLDEQDDKLKELTDEDEYDNTVIQGVTTALCRADFPRLRFIRVVITTYPLHYGRDYADSTPDVLNRAGWIEFDSGSGLFGRERIEFENHTFEAPSRAVGFCIFLPSGVQADVFVFQKKPKQASS